VFETAVNQGAEQLRLQEKILETRRMHADVVAFAPFLPPDLGSLMEG